MAGEAWKTQGISSPTLWPPCSIALNGKPMLWLVAV